MGPGLAEGITAVIIVGDTRDDPRQAFPESFATVFEIVPDTINVKRAIFCNPLDSDRIAVIRRFTASYATDYAAAAELVYNLQPQTGFVLNPIRGQRLVSGYQANVLGGAPPPPIQGLDVSFPAKPSRMGYHSPAINGIDGGYIWHAVLNGTAARFTEDFHDQNGPRVIVYPGGSFTQYIIDTNAHWYANIWWDEYPLTA